MSEAADPSPEGAVAPAGAAPPGRVGGADPDTEVSLRCWGTRGSIPAPGPETAGFGGNTPCLEVRAGGGLFVFDAGTGIRLLGTRLAERARPVEATIFLTHFHWDHIQGFPFFAPLYDPATRLRILGPRQGEVDVEKLFAGQMGPIYFPIPYSALAADLSFGHTERDDFEESGVRVRAFRVRHPSYTVGYRLEAGGRAVCYVPDNELVGGDYPMGPEWRDEMTAFVEGADVLIHDAMFTETEYPARVGWGHSTFDQTLDLAAEAGVKRLLFFHHAPDRADSELNRLLADQRERAGGLGFEVGAAFEGREIEL